MTDRNDRYKYPILETCQALHAHNCGSGDRMLHSVKQSFIDWLVYRSETWSTTTPCCAMYDNMVYGLVMATLAESSQ